MAIATVDAAPQHLRALQHANKVRLARAELKRQIAEQQISVIEVIARCPWQAGSMAISDLLMSQRRWGRARCRRLLVSLGIPENKQISTFTERQRSALVAVLSARTGQPRPEGGASEPCDHVEVRGPHSSGRTAMVASL
ncbi:MAG: hypothetical protein ACXVRH_05365 [Thermoleophilaceae bacterium]